MQDLLRGFLNMDPIRGTSILLCGYDAFNAILKVLGKSPVERDFMDTAAKDLAQQEAELLYDT